MPSASAERCRKELAACTAILSSGVPREVDCTLLATQRAFIEASIELDLARPSSYTARSRTWPLAIELAEEDSPSPRGHKRPRSLHGHERSPIVVARFLIHLGSYV